MMIAQTVLVALVSAGASLSGNWSLTTDRDFKDNRNVLSECVFRQNGTQLTVRCRTGSPEFGSELTGSVNGRTVTWALEPKNGEKYPAATWTGTLNEAGTRIKGTWRLSVIGGDKQGSFTAVKRSDRGGRRGPLEFHSRSHE